MYIFIDKSLTLHKRVFLIEFLNNIFSLRSILDEQENIGRVINSVSAIQPLKDNRLVTFV